MRSILPLAAILVLGCADDDGHPPVQACSGLECHGPPILGYGASTANPDGDSEGGAPGAAQPPVFSVARFESDDFLATTAFAEPATVLADGEGGTTVEAAWNGLDPFAIAGLADTPFVLVEPEGSSSDALPTLLVPSLVSPVELPVVRATVMESILALSSVPLDLDGETAQLVLKLIDVNARQPISGAVLAEPSAETVLYAASGGWSDTAGETDATGLAVLASVPASAWPGRLISVAVSGTASGAIPLRVVAGAVTVLYVGIEL